MFVHRLIRERNLSILEISNSAGTMARFVPERGGILAELQLSGVRVFYLDEETLHNPDKNIRGGNPVLFPICGPLNDGEYQVEGRTYRMRQHGLARNIAWKAGKPECTKDGASVKFTLHSDEESKLVYPFDFRLEFTYDIYPDRVTIRQKYNNDSMAEMPFYAGFHPYFFTPGLEIRKLHIPACEYEDLKTGLKQPFNGQVDLSAASETNLVFADLTDSQAWFERRDGQKIKVMFDTCFKYLVLWALKDKDFLCVEPWMGNNYDLNRGKAVLLNPGEEMNAEVSYFVK